MTFNRINGSLSLLQQQQLDECFSSGPATEVAARRKESLKLSVIDRFLRAVRVAHKSDPSRGKKPVERRSLV